MISTPRRVHVSTTEKLIGGGILLLLVAVGLLIHHKGQRYDPSIFTVDEASLETTRNPIDNKAGTLRDASPQTETVSLPAEAGYDEYDSYGDGANVSEAAGGRMGGSSGHAAIADSGLYAGFAEMGELEVYSPDTLYEKINGRAPAYLGFNFQELSFRTYGIESLAGQYLDVFIYEMDTPVNAFGIFSLEREAGAPSVDFVTDGYRSDMGFFFRQGNTYVQVIASDLAADVMDAAAQFSHELAGSIPVDDSGVGAVSMLPAEFQISGSTSYIQEYAYGLEQLNDVFEARYEVDGLEFPFFGMASDTESLESAFESVKAYFSDYGQIIESFEVNGYPVVVGEIFGQYSVVFLSDQAIGGVMNADALEVPKAFVVKTLERMKPKTFPVE